VGVDSGSLVPAVSFRPMIVSTVTVQVDGGRWSFRNRDDVIYVAAGRGHGAGRVGADAVPEFDRRPQFAGREPAHFGDIEQIAPFVGEQSVEQGPRLGGEFADHFGRNQRTTVHQVSRGGRGTEQRLRGHHDPDGHRQRAQLMLTWARCDPESA